MLNTYTLKRLILITALCAIPVVWVIISNSSGGVGSKYKKLLPELFKQHEQVSLITIQNHDESLTLQKNDNGWVALEHSNYPVITAKVDNLLLNLSELQVIEPKTAKPELHEQLGVNNINDPYSSAFLVTVKNNNGNDIAKLYIGNREEVQLSNKLQENIFVRLADESQTWLVQGVLPLSTDLNAWVEPPLLSIFDSEQLQRLIINTPDESNIVISKTTTEQQNFVLESAKISKSMTLDIDTVNNLPVNIVGLEFNNVILAQAANLDWSKSVIATLDTFSGVRVLLNVMKHEDKVYAKVCAETTAMTESIDAAVHANVKSYNAAMQPWVFELSKDFYNAITL